VGSSLGRSSTHRVPGILGSGTLSPRGAAVLRQVLNSPLLLLVPAGSSQERWWKGVAAVEREL